MSMSDNVETPSPVSQPSRVTVVDLNAPLLEDVAIGGVAVLALTYAVHLLKSDLGITLPMIAFLLIMVLMAGMKLNRDGKRIRVDEGNRTLQVGHEAPVPFSQVEISPGRVLGGKGVALFQFKMETPTASATVTNKRGAFFHRKWRDREVSALTVLVDNAGSEEFQRSWRENWVPVLLNKLPNPDTGIQSQT